MKKSIFISGIITLLLSCQNPAKSNPKTKETKWEGNLRVENFNLKLLFRINEEKCFLTVPAQAVSDWPSNTLRLTKDSIQVEYSGMKASFHGKLFEDSIAGEWIQLGKTYPLTMIKKKPYVRPQTPKPPYPYKTEEVSYLNPDKSIQFGGTLTLPKQKGKHPVAILITGSGQEDRDETLFSHKPFWIIADYLTRQNIAILRVDDRGVGKTTGLKTLKEVTSYDFAQDIMTAMDYLKTRKEIDPQRIGLIGHSEGSMIASLVASERDDVAFIVSLAGPGVSGKKIGLSQIENSLEKTMPRETIQNILPIEEKIIEIILNEENNRLAWVSINNQCINDIFQADSLVQKFYGVQEKDGFKTMDTKPLKAKYDRMMIPWFRYFLAYSPQSVLPNVKTPFLAMNGEKDTQVLADLNLKGIKEIFTSCHKTNYEIISYPNLNHFFQNCETGYMEEVEAIEETISPKVLEDMGVWITKQVKN